MQPIDLILRDRFGLETFRPHQHEVIEAVLGGRDCLCIMPTGAGKSLCFQVPAVALDGLTVVVSPLISLMADQVRQLRERKIPAHYLNSSQAWEEQRRVLDHVRGGFRGLLYLAPERLAAESFQRTLAALAPRLLVIDEAHCLSQWGHDFRPEYKKLAQLRVQLGSPVTMALTATATPQVQKDIVEMLALRSPSLFVTGFDRPNLVYAARELEKDEQKQATLLGFLRERRGSGIVYCSTRKTVEAVTALLQRSLPKRAVVAYHAGLDQRSRESAQRKFITDPQAIVVATNAFGMGINKPETRFVVHFNLPGSLEAYYQEAGRAGRDGEPAHCLLLFNQRDRRTQEWFIRTIGDNNPQLTAAEIERQQELSRRNLDRVHAFAEQRRCRRLQILEYFGESSRVEHCGCDVCVPTRAPAAKAAAVAPSGAGKKKRLSTPVQAASPNDREVVESLRAVRNRLAKEGKLPAYCILQDRSLEEIARTKPRSREALAEVWGVGDAKAQKYGAELLSALGHVRQEKLALAASEAAPAPELDSRLIQLRGLREKLAQQHRLPPYFVLRDATLVEIARAMPPHLRALSEISGVGEKKADQFGAAILELLHG